MLIIYRNDKGEIHNINVFAFITEDLKAYMVNGKKHNINGPAIIKGVLKEWYLNSLLQPSQN